MRANEIGTVGIDTITYAPPHHNMIRSSPHGSPIKGAIKEYMYIEFIDNA